MLMTLMNALNWLFVIALGLVVIYLVVAGVAFAVLWSIDKAPAVSVIVATLITICVQNGLSLSFGSTLMIWGMMILFVVSVRVWRRNMDEEVWPDGWRTKR